jgi:hypothetical protein
LDAGCGVAGPLVNIARFGRYDMTGVTINQHQVQAGGGDSEKTSTRRTFFSFL